MLQGFGSFMVEESVEALVGKSDALYEAPPLPFELPQPPLEVSEVTPLGKPCREWAAALHLCLVH